MINTIGSFALIACLMLFSPIVLCEQASDFAAAVLCGALTLSLNPLHHGAEDLIALVDAGGLNFLPSGR